MGDREEYGRGGGEDWIIYPHLTGRETREWRNETRLVKWSSRMQTTRSAEGRRRPGASSARFETHYAVLHR